MEGVVGWTSSLPRLQTDCWHLGQISRHWFEFSTAARIDCCCGGKGQTHARFYMAYTTSCTNTGLMGVCCCWWPQIIHRCSFEEWAVFVLVLLRKKSGAPKPQLKAPLVLALDVLPLRSIGRQLVATGYRLSRKYSSRLEAITVKNGGLGQLQIEKIIIAISANG